jgi:hypothetical protein
LHRDVEQALRQRDDAAVGHLLEGS